MLQYRLPQRDISVTQGLTFDAHGVTEGEESGRLHFDVPDSKTPQLFEERVFLRLACRAQGAVQTGLA